MGARARTQGINPITTTSLKRLKLYHRWQHICRWMFLQETENDMWEAYCLIKTYFLCNLF